MAHTSVEPGGLQSSDGFDGLGPALCGTTVPLQFNVKHTYRYYVFLVSMDRSPSDRSCRDLGSILVGCHDKEGRKEGPGSVGIPNSADGHHTTLLVVAMPLPPRLRHSSCPLPEVSQPTHYLRRYLGTKVPP
jgi:hypothetical protein